MLEGLTAEQSGPAGKNLKGMVYGARIHFLLDRHPSLAPGVVGTWHPRDPRPAEWGPEWEPINKQTVSLEDTTIQGHSIICKGLVNRWTQMVAADLEGIEKGTRLPEEDTPAGPYASFSDLIQVHNNSCGKCPCGRYLTAGAKARTSDGHWRLFSEGAGVVWTVERKENFLMHLRSNIKDTAICKYCQSETSANPIQHGHPGVVTGNLIVNSRAVALAGQTPAERKASAAALMRQRSAVLGGPKAVWPSNLRDPGNHSARYSETSIFVCLFPDCDKELSSYCGMLSHVRKFHRPWCDKFQGSLLGNAFREERDVSEARRKKVKADNPSGGPQR